MKAVTAAELMARLEADPEFVAEREREEAERQKLAAAIERELAPLVEDMRVAGCDLASVSELAQEPYPDSAPYPEGLPILLTHLERPYSVEAREIIARALAVPEARAAWNELTHLYRDESAQMPKDGLAVALAAVADDRVIADVIALAHDTENGPSRLLLLCALERSTDPRAQAALADLAKDPELSDEIHLILDRLKRRKRRER